MPILDEIESFFAAQPQWQRMCYSALREGTPIDDRFIEELAEQCEKDVLASKPASSAPRSTSSVEAGEAPHVHLVSVENVIGIDDLAPGQSLKFSPDGLTIVYGDNGSGKSGYGRILRQVCLARGSAVTLRGNVFKASGTLEAEVVFHDGTAEQRTKVGSTPPSPGPLRHVSVFDTGAAHGLVGEQNDAAFRPFGLDLLDLFTKAVDAVKARLDAKIQALATPHLQTDRFSDATKAGKVAKELGRLAPAALEEALKPLTEEQENRRTSVRDILTQAKANDPQKVAQAYDAKAERIEAMNGRLRKVIAGVSKETVTAYAKLKSLLREAEEAAEAAREAAFSGEPLREVGAGAWRAMWDAARSYAAVAGAGNPLDSAVAGDKCVLCAQPLDQSAADRVKAFETFVKGELQTTVARLKKQAKESKDAFDRLPINAEGDDALIRELQPDHPDLAEIARTIFKDGGAIAGKADEYGEEELASFAAAPDIPPGLSALPEELRKKATELRGSADAASLAKLGEELAELDEQDLLFKSADLARKEAARLRKLKSLDAAKRSVSTRQASELSKTLTTRYVSEALCARFVEEVGDLGLTRLNVSLAPVGAQKGRLFHKISFSANPSAPLGDVLSEGEFRCLALAAFLAEVGGGKSGILFDDPVSSLDHKWRQRIAERLVREAKTRQVVVFTHDIAFAFLLKDAAAAPHHNIVPIERCIERRGGAQAGFCRDSAPWAGLKTTSRIGVLRNDLVGIKKRFRDGDSDYERVIRDWYGRLRESWERSIEECLLNDAVRRFSHAVETNRLKKALTKIKPGDWAEIEKGMTRASSAFRGHDGSPELNPPIPTPEEAERDLEEFENWVKTKNS